MSFRHLPFTLVAASFAALAFGACEPHDTDEACMALGNDAVTALEDAQRGYLACQVDTDCVETAVNQSGQCAAPCGGLVDTANVQTFIDKATSVCRDFDESCPKLTVECPSSGPFLCASGTCAYVSAVFSVQAPSAPITHGVCAAFELDYVAPDGTTTVSHGTAVAIHANGGSLFADAACTMPLAVGATVTVPSGAHDVAFGFEATAAGAFSIWAGVGGGNYVAQ
jgi:hypothetical protein